ncbi:hypothetical protein ACFLWS_05090 [Chloroflexota bacterium]
MVGDCERIACFLAGNILSNMSVIASGKLNNFISTGKGLTQP